MRYAIFISSTIWLFISGAATAIIFRHRCDFDFIVNFIVFSTLGLTIGIAMVAAYYSGQSILRSKNETGKVRESEDMQSE